MNFTTEDFLNEFQREATKNHDVTVPLETDFEFFVSYKIIKETAPEPENLTPIEKIYKYKLNNNKTLIDKLDSNYKFISRNLLNEIDKIMTKMEEISKFLSENEITIEAFKSNRKLQTFINSAITINLLCARLINLTKIFKKEASDLTSKSDNLSKLIQHILDTHHNLFNSIIDMNLTKKLSHSTEIKNEKVCMLCLNDLDSDNHTNLFSYDFHILCINFWLNCVDNKSPFIV